MANLQVGQPAPDFKLPDYKGIEFQLSTYKDNHNVYLVLNRGFS